MNKVERLRFSRRQFLIQGGLVTSVAAVGATGLLDPRVALAGTRAGQLLTFSDTFQRADSSTVGNGWDPLRGSWGIVSDSLQPTAGSPGDMEISQTAFQLGRVFSVEAEVSLGAPGGSHNGIAFNITDSGSGLQNSYALTLNLGSPSIWALWGVVNSGLTVIPAFQEIDIVADHPYTLRVSSEVYGWFDVTILDGSTVLVAQRVQLDPWRAQLAGGYPGVFSQLGSQDGGFKVLRLSATSTSDPSSPPPPPADDPLVCTPVQGPPYTLPNATWSVVDSSLVDDTQSIVAVGQALLTNGDIQYVAYYDADKQMTVASRTPGSDTWLKQPLPEYVGTDGHNSVTMAVDRDGQLHVAGDMHNVPLIYFRTTTAGDITTLTRIDSMVDPATETSETYPVFLYNAAGALIYNYRSGVSGNGVTYYNIYDESTQTWSRLFDQPLFDGQGAGNSYPSSPLLGPDGNFHMVWVWRATGDAATNFNLSYARSPDLVNWQTIDGDAITLPITKTTPGVTVDPIPVYQGLLNGIPTVGFDAGNEVLISYYKLDRASNTQVYVGRPRPGLGNRWDVIQVSRWTGRYVAQGEGTIPPQPLVGPVSTLPDGHLQLSYSYAPNATTSYSGTWVLDAGTLQPVTEAPIGEILRFGNPPLPNLPASMRTVQSTFPGMAVQLRADSGSSGSATQQYFLRYEALPSPPSKAPYPPASPLQVYLVQSS